MSAQDLQAWIRFRALYGLRTDVEWVLAVARDPSAMQTGYGVPMLRWEFDSVLRAMARVEGLVSIARDYGNDFSEFSGAWIESPRVVIAFADRLEEHQREAAALFGDIVAIRPVRFTLVQLAEFKAAVEAERDWLPTIGAKFITVDIDEPANGVSLQYQAPSQDVEGVIRAHFGVPDWLSLVWAGVGAWNGPTGDAELTVINQDGQPVWITCLLSTTDPRVGVQPEERDLPDGRCFDKGLAAVTWVAEITFTLDGNEVTITHEFVVAPGSTYVTKLVVHADPSPGITN